MIVAALDKCTVTGPVLKPDGTPCSPGYIKFTLSARDRDGDITIMPPSVEADIDDDGNVSVDLWPNSDGYAGTVYTVQVWHGKRDKGGTAFPTFTCVVPDEETANLADIMDLSPPASVDDATAAKIAAQGYAVSAHNDAVSTASDRTAIEAIIGPVATVAPHIDEVTAVAAITGQVDAVAAIVDKIVTVAGIQDDVSLVAAISAKVTAVANSIDGVNALAAALDNVNSLAAAIDALNAAAGISANVTTVAANNANVATVAGNIAAILDAATQAANAAASATGAANTKAAMDAALAGVTDYSDTLGQLSPAAKQIVAATDVVVAFLYDTTKDSDCGAWRKRCTHTSWYKETLNTSTRGVRRGFPSKALIVVRNGTVTIYDADTASCPMWMVFGANFGNLIGSVNLQTSGSSVCALNGMIIFGAAQYDAHGIDLILDRGWRSGIGITAGGYASTIADRNAGSNFIATGWQPGQIVNRTVNAIAATVLPGTPIDLIRGLPNPTIAVSTASGVSVIHWDGRVCSSAYNAVSFNRIRFLSGGTLWTTFGGYNLFIPLPTYQVSGFDIFANGTYFDGAHQQPISNLTSDGSNNLVRATGKTEYLGCSLGLRFMRREAVLYKSSAALITSKFNTGHMVGDIRMALAESTADVSSLVGATPLNDDFSSYADTAAMVAAGWTVNGPSTLSLVSGKLRVTQNGAGGNGRARRTIATVAGRRYRATIEVSDANVTGIIYLFAPNGSSIDNRSGNGSISGTFVATGATANIDFGFSGAALDTEYADFDNIRVDLVAEDRSVAGNHPTVVGTITRAAVNGGELAAYGGFSSANYAVVPYAAALDFGTADFCAIAWVKYSAGNYNVVFSYGDGTTQAGWMLRWQHPNSRWEWAINWNGQSRTVADTEPTTWTMIAMIRHSSGVVDLYRNGVLIDSSAGSGSGTTASVAGGTLQIGVGNNLGSGVGNSFGGTIALPRVSATAPTPAQIRAIYEDERHLFEAGAKCLLPGDSVSALAYDDDTGLLHVATTAGSARLKGLTVVDKDTTVYTGIDAKGGVIATRDADSADIVLPSVGLREAAVAGIGHNGGPPLYDRKTVDLPSCAVTTNATPTVIARLPMGKGEAGEWVIDIAAREYGDPAAPELAAYRRQLFAYRPGEGNVTISGSVTATDIRETTSTMDVTVTANTTTQTLDITATGVASKNIEWGVRAVFAPVSMQ